MRWWRSQLCHVSGGTALSRLLWQLDRSRPHDGSSWMRHCSRRFSGERLGDTSDRGGLRFQRVVEQRQPLSHQLATERRLVCRLELEKRLGFAGVDADIHPGFPRDVHHCCIFRQAMHVHARDKTVACVLDRAREQRTSDSPRAMPGKDRYAELGAISAERDMSRGGKTQLVFVDAEDGIGVEIDTLNVRRDRFGPERQAEPQSDILGIKAQKMFEQFRPRGLGEAVNVNGAHPGSDPARHGARRYLRHWMPGSGKYAKGGIRNGTRRTRMH